MDPAKAVAIGLVIFYHAQGYSNIVSRSRADAGVDAFLLLSGFGLAYAAKVEPTWRFLTRRVWRLLPAYWLVLALIVLVNHFRGLPIDAKQVWYHVACVHLIIGDPYTLGISDSLWFIGLIVPLYFIYAALRPWVARDAITLPELDADGKPSDRAGAGYALLALAAMVAAVAGWYLQLHYKSWGPMALGHAPNRLPAFFVGAIAGLIARRREPLAGVVGRPMLLLGLTGTAAVALVYGWAGPPLFTIAGSAAIGIAVVVTQASRRWKLLRPTVLLLAGLGAMSYELFLCHQYVMRWIGDSFVLPYVSLHKPRYTNGSPRFVGDVDRFGRRCADRVRRALGDRLQAEPGGLAAHADGHTGGDSRPGGGRRGVAGEAAFGAHAEGAVDRGSAQRRFAGRAGRSGAFVRVGAGGGPGVCRARPRRRPGAVRRPPLGRRAGAERMVGRRIAV